MKTIGVPTDLSEISLNAVSYGGRNDCDCRQCAISLICVWPLQVSYSELPLSGYTTAEVIADAELTLKKGKEDIAQQTGGEIITNFEVKQGGHYSRD
jgi:hypothetical protein